MLSSIKAQLQIAIELLMVKQLDKIQIPQIREKIRLSASIITHIQFNLLSVKTLYEFNRIIQPVAIKQEYFGFKADECDLTVSLEAKHIDGESTQLVDALTRRQLTKITT